MLSHKTLKPTLRNKTQDKLFLAIKRKLRGGTRLSTVCEELGITPSTAANIMQKHGTTIKEQRELK